MGAESVIEWTDSTWNPWRGCDKVSPGCAHCYMFTDQRRYGRDPSVVVRCADSTFFAPVRSRKWAEARDQAIAKKGAHYVFTCSWSDWFHEDADAWRDEAWEVIAQCPESTFQILTKRPERIAGRLPRWWGDADCEAPENVWLGTTIENRRFVHRADQLREIPAAVRFISAEPLLGPLAYDDKEYVTNGADYASAGWWEGFWKDNFEGPELDLTDIHWLITGGESGPGHRRFDPRWAIDLRDACADAGTAFLHKQNGGPKSTSHGRLLDGQTYDGMPQMGVAP